MMDSAGATHCTVHKPICWHTNFISAQMMLKPLSLEPIVLRSTQPVRGALISGQKWKDFGWPLMMHSELRLGFHNGPAQVQRSFLLVMHYPFMRCWGISRIDSPCWSTDSKNKAAFLVSGNVETDFWTPFNYAGLTSCHDYISVSSLFCYFIVFVFLTDMDWSVWNKGQLFVSGDSIFLPFLLTQPKYTHTRKKLLVWQKDNQGL